MFIFLDIITHTRTHSYVLIVSNSSYKIQVECACSALSDLASDISVALQLVKADIMQPIEIVLKSLCREEMISVLKLSVKLAFTSDAVAKKMLSKDILKSLKLLCGHKDPEVSMLVSSYR